MNNYDEVIQFILDSQLRQEENFERIEANFERLQAQLDALAVRQTSAQTEIDHLTRSTLASVALMGTLVDARHTTDEKISALISAQIRTEESINRLVGANSRTDTNLNEFIEELRRRRDQEEGKH
jgi:hypothetical protein